MNRAGSRDPRGAAVLRNPEDHKYFRKYSQTCMPPGLDQRKQFTHLFPKEQMHERAACKGTGTAIRV